jgi:hypothetical protein
MLPDGQPNVDAHPQIAVLLTFVDRHVYHEHSVHPDGRVRRSPESLIETRQCRKFWFASRKTFHLIFQCSGVNFV